MDWLGYRKQNILLFVLIWRILKGMSDEGQSFFIHLNMSLLREGFFLNCLDMVHFYGMVG